MPRKSNKKFQNYLKTPYEYSFFLKEIEPDEIIQTTSESKYKKASNIYEISPKTVKISAEKIKESLALIFNMLFRNGVFHGKLKFGVVYLIHKGKFKTARCNY